MKKSLLTISILTFVGSAIAFCSGFSSTQNDFRPSLADGTLTEIKPFAKYDFTSNTSDDPGHDSSGNGFDLKKRRSPGESGCSFNINETNGLQIVNVPTQPSDNYYMVADDGYNLYAPELGSSGYDFSDMIEGAYTMNFTASFDPTVKNPGQYMISFGLYEDCFTFVPYTEHQKDDTWMTFIEFQFHNSGLEGLSFDSESKTSTTGRKIDTYVYRYLIKNKDGSIDLTNEFKNKFHNYSIVGDASNKTMHFYIDGVEATLYNRYFNIKYENGIEIPNGIKLTDLTGKTGRSYAFSLGSQITINGGSGRQYGTFSMKDFVIYNCALNSTNCLSLFNNRKAYMENENDYRVITSLNLERPVDLKITDVNSTSALIAGGKLPKNVIATLDDGSKVHMPVFWYDDPDNKQIYGIPSIGKFQDDTMPDNIDGIFNPTFERAILPYDYYVDFDYNPVDFDLFDVAINGNLVSLGELPKQISYSKGSSTEVTFKVKCNKDHGELAKIVYDGTPWPDSMKKEGDIYICNLKVGKGALIKLVLGIETGTITYCRSNDNGKYEIIPGKISTYSYGGDEDLLPLEEINAVLSPDFYSAGYFFDKNNTIPFTKDDLDYYNIKNLTLYVNEKGLSDHYNLTVDSSTGGSVTGAKNRYDYVKGDDECFKTNIEITPASGYMIDSVSWNSELINVENPRKTFVLEHSITSNSTLTVRFRKLNLYYITPHISGKGTVERKDFDEDSKEIPCGTFDDPYYEGDKIYVYITPDTDNGYMIDSVEFGGVSLELTPEEKKQGYILPQNNIDKDYHLVVNFALPRTYSVSINGLGVGGTATGNKDSYQFGEKANITLTPNAKYHIASAYWGKTSLLDEYELNDDGSLTISEEVTADTTLAVSFEPDKYYSVVTNIVNSDGGSIQGLGQEYMDGAHLTDVKVVANSGYSIQTIMWGNNTIEITDSKTMDLSTLVVNSAVANNNVCTLTVVFKEADKNIVYVSQSGQGQVNGQTEFDQNINECQFTIIPAAGYTLKSVKWNGEDVTNQVSIVDGKISLPLTSSSYLVVKFIKTSSGETGDTIYTISDSSSAIGYEVFGLDDRIFVKDDNVSLTIAPNDGFEISSVQITKGSGEVSSSDGLFFITINELSGDVEFEVETINVKNNKVSIVTNDSHISVSGIENDEYYVSGNKTVIFTTDEGYLIDRITVNGSDLSILPNTRTFITNININENVEIYAYSKKINDTKVFITPSDYEGGTISGVNADGYLPGSYATITIEADSGYFISNVSYNGQSINIDDSDKFSFTIIVNENSTLNASFSQKSGVNITSYVNDSSLGTVSGCEGYDIGETTNIVITANEGSYIGTVQFNGEYLDVTDNKQLTINKVINQQTNVVNVSFVTVSTYKVTPNINIEDAGSISGVKEKYVSGETTNIEVNASYGYEIEAIVFNGQSLTLSSKKSYVVKEQVYSDVDLQVIFKEPISNNYSISLLNNEGGEIEDLYPSYSPNSEVEFSISADEDHIIYKVVINGEEKKIDNNKNMTVSFTITQDTNVDVLFANPKYVTLKGGCVNSITGSLAAVGGLSVALIGMIIIRKKERK